MSCARHARILVAAAAVWSAGGCASDTKALSAPDAALAEGQCRSDRDCEGWCVGEPGCADPWACVSEIPCSAAPPFLACDCEGRISDLASGCPGAQYAWRDPTSAVRVTNGEPCDPDDRDAFRADVTVRGADFAAHEGERVWVQIFDPAANHLTGQTRLDVAAGTFEHTWRGGLNPTLEGAYIDVFVLDGDGECRPDAAWRLPVERPSDGDATIVSLTADRRPDAGVCP